MMIAWEGMRPEGGVSAGEDQPMQEVRPCEPGPSMQVETPQLELGTAAHLKQPGMLAMLEKLVAQAATNV